MALVVFQLLRERAGGKALASNKAFPLAGHALSLSIRLGTGLMCSHPRVGVMSLLRVWALCHQPSASHVQLTAAGLGLPKCSCGCPSGDRQEAATRALCPCWCFRDSKEKECSVDSCCKTSPSSISTGGLMLHFGKMLCRCLIFCFCTQQPFLNLQELLLLPPAFISQPQRPRSCSGVKHSCCPRELPIFPLLWQRCSLLATPSILPWPCAAGVY